MVNKICDSWKSIFVYFFVFLFVVFWNTQNQKHLTSATLLNKNATFVFYFQYFFSKLLFFLLTLYCLSQGVAFEANLSKKSTWFSFLFFLGFDPSLVGNSPASTVNLSGGSGASYLELTNLDSIPDALSHTLCTSAAPTEHLSEPILFLQTDCQASVSISFYCVVFCFTLFKRKKWNKKCQSSKFCNSFVFNFVVKRRARYILTVLECHLTSL